MKRRKVSKDHLITLTKGPGRLCMALGLSAKQNAADLCIPPLHIDTGLAVDEENIAQTTRVNVDYADDWKDLPWRFFIRNNAFVSKQASK